MIRLSDVSKRYAERIDALANVTLAVERGELVIVTGPSGAGKSTLLKLIAGIEAVSSGSVVIAGQNLARLGANALAYVRQNIGLVFQDHKLLYDRNVFDNVVLPLQIAGLPRTDAARRVRAALEKVGLLERERAMPIALSGGEQQRLALARAIVNRPQLLIVDEPTANLDADYAAAIADLLRAFQAVGTTVIVATHDHATLGAARAIRLDRGRLVS